jgi:hypothetical protein
MKTNSQTVLKGFLKAGKINASNIQGFLVMQGVDANFNNAKTLRYYVERDDLEMVRCLIEEKL